jgi:ubiquinone biosynthesis UbiH/UbiF/VisC/COQ6 family hydroxylase
MKTYDLIIVGAGIAGKATSLRFAQLGLKILHLAPSFDAGFHGSDSSVWDSRIYALSASSKNLLEQLHVWSALDASRIQAVSDMRVFGDSGQADDEIHFSAFSATVPQLSWIIESGHIEKTLDAAIQFQGLIERITDKVIDVVSNNEGVTVTTESGLNVCGKLVLAADGAHSFVREKLQIETTQNTYDQTAVVANFQAEKHHQGTACQWFLPGGEILALLPLPDKKLSMVWSASTEHAERLKKISSESLCAEVIRAAQGQVEQRTGQLKMLTAQQGFPLRRMKAKRMIAPDARPRIALIGDAAHAMHPLAGQGLNLGLRDVASLADILDNKEAFRVFDDPVLLRRFERARHGDTDALLFTTDRLQKLFANEAGHVKTIRNLGMKLVNRSHFLKRRLIKQALA